MEKQTVYIAVSKMSDYILSEKESATCFLEKKENVYVFTSQEFEKAIGDAFDAGMGRAFCNSNLFSVNNMPNKTEYLNNLKP